MLEADRFTTVIAKVRPDRIERAAIITEHLGGIERIYLYLCTAVLTVCAEVLEALKVPALTLPVADLILDVLKSRRFSKIGNRKDRGKYRLQPDEITFLRDQVHLQEPVIRFALDLDQIRNLRRCVDLRKIHALRCVACSAAEPV